MGMPFIPQNGHPIIGMFLFLTMGTLFLPWCVSLKRLMVIICHSKCSCHLFFKIVMLFIPLKFTSNWSCSLYLEMVMLFFLPQNGHVLCTSKWPCCFPCYLSPKMVTLLVPQDRHVICPPKWACHLSWPPNGHIVCPLKWTCYSSTQMVMLFVLKNGHVMTCASWGTNNMTILGTNNMPM